MRTTNRRRSPDRGRSVALVSAYLLLGARMSDPVGCAPEFAATGWRWERRVVMRASGEASGQFVIVLPLLTMIFDRAARGMMPK